MAKLLYGSGLRFGECLRLRVKACPERSRRDVDFAQHQIVVRDGKGPVLSEVEGMKDWVTMLLGGSGNGLPIAAHLGGQSTRTFPPASGSATASWWAAHRVRLQRGHYHGGRTHIQ
jgi:hypothetical protein